MTAPAHDKPGPGRGWLSGLTARQAAATLLVAALLGVLGSAVELVADWRIRRAEVARNAGQVLAMVQGAAEAAAYQLDAGLSQQVADGLLGLDAVVRVTLTDDYGGRLAMAARPGDNDNRNGALAAWLFGDVTAYSLPLQRRDDNGQVRALGRLDVTLSADRLADSFFRRAAVNAGLGVLRAVGICAVLALLFNWMVTRPIVRLAQEVDRVDPARPAARLIPTPKGTENDEIGDLAGALNHLLTAFQASLTQRDSALAENARMGAELDISRQLQRMVLPTRAELDAIAGLDIATYMEPAAEVGGDYYDILPGRDGRVRIGIGDVTGHGLESGVVMLMTQSAVRSLMTREDHDGPLLGALNHMMFHNLQRMGSDRNLTLALADYQPLTAQAAGDPVGRLRVSGQHETVLVARADGRFEMIDTVELGMPIGLVDDISGFLADADALLWPGDVVVLYTDGITEAADAANRLFGLEQLCQTVRDNRHRPAEDIKQAVLDAVAAHIGGQAIWDDLTLVVLKQR